MNLSLRPFNEKDLVHLDSWSLAVGSEQYMQKITPMNYSFTDDFDKWGNDYVWFAITLDGEAVGGVWIDRRRSGDTLGILGIIIGKPDVLSKGIGRRSIAMAIQEASRILGITRVRLTVRKTNVRAIKAYTSSGFEVIREGRTMLDDGTAVLFYRMETDIVEKLG